jgi:Tetratricopeptide repeat
VLYILRIAATDYGKESTLLVKSPCPPDGVRGLSDTHSQQAARQPVTGVSDRMEQLLIAVSVYRTAADYNAIVFQLGQHDWTAARAPDRRGPAPPYEPPADLRERIADCIAAELLATAPDSGLPADSWVVDPWLAAELHRQLGIAGRRAELTAAHRRAAEYWQWRSAAWPQGRRQDLHDLLEARHHLFLADETDRACEVTRMICAQLHAWGDLGREAELIQGTLDLLPDGSAGWASWMLELGTIHQVRAELEEAQRCYATAVDTFATLGEHEGVARGQHSLGVLAQAQGDYRRAERHYRRSSLAESRAAGAVPVLSEPDAAVPDAAVPDAAVPDAAVPVRGSEAGAPIRLAASAPTRQPQLDLPAEVRKPPAPRLAPVVPPPRPVVPSPASARPTLPRPPASPVASPRLRAQRYPADGLPAGRWRPPARRRRVPAPRALLVVGLTVAAVAVPVLLLARPTAHATGPLRPSQLSPAAARLATAAWVAGQVSRSAVVGCDPAMCAALAQRGVPPGDLLTLGPDGPPDPLAANVLVATAALRAEFGERLAGAYAPEVLASFGSGPAEIEVRAVAPDGVPAFLAAIRNDLAARRQFGASLLANRNLLAPATARTELAAGDVDSRLLAALATVAHFQHVRIVAFGDAGPGAGAAVPLRSVIIAPAGPGSAGWARSVLSFLDAQEPPFRPAGAFRVTRAGAPDAVLVQYASPSPLGLLTTLSASSGWPLTHQ